MSCITYSLAGYKALAKIRVRRHRAQGIEQGLHDAQAAIATQNGFRSWQAFREAVLEHERRRSDPRRVSRVDRALNAVPRPVSIDAVCAALIQIEDYNPPGGYVPPDEIRERQELNSDFIFKARATVKAFGLDMQPASLEAMEEAARRLGEMVERRFCISDLAEAECSLAWHGVGPWRYQLARHVSPDKLQRSPEEKVLYLEAEALVLENWNNAV